VRKAYEVAQHQVLDVPFFEVRGAEFCAEDLFELVGKNEYTCTFRFRAGSDAHNVFGGSITGSIVYSPKERAALLSEQSSAETGGCKHVRIQCVRPELPQELLDELRYKGSLIADIEQVQFLPYSPPQEANPDGTKKVPGIIHIDLPENALEADIDLLFQSYVVMKHNDEVELIPYEKERLIATILEMRGGRIDSRILSTLEFTPSEASESAEICFHRLTMRKRRGALTEADQERLNDLSAIRWLTRAKLLMEEIQRSGVVAVNADAGAIATISKSMTDFESHVFLTRKKQVYWDWAGYLHIAMRHVRELQVGSFTAKTPFPYKADDLELLVGQVLRQVEGEIDRHFEGPPPRKEFRRQGAMAVYFNGDYFHLRIDQNGRLIQFHAVGEARNRVEQGFV